MGTDKLLGVHVFLYAKLDIFYFDFLICFHLEIGKKNKSNHGFPARFLLKKESGLSCWDVEELEKEG